MASKKIAIMTWHNYDNYGGILQAFALRKKVKDLDVDKVDFIDYASKPKEIRLYKRLTLKNIRNKVKAIKCNFSIYIKERAKLFDGFRKNTLLIHQSVKMQVSFMS